MRPRDARKRSLSWSDLSPTVLQMYLPQQKQFKELGFESFILSVKNDKKYIDDLVRWKSAVSKLLGRLTLCVLHQMWVAIGNILTWLLQKAAGKSWKKTPLITGARYRSGVSSGHGQRELAVLDVVKEIPMCISTIFAKLQMFGDFMWRCHCWLREKWCDGVLSTSRIQVQWQYLCDLLVFSNSSIPGPSKFNYHSGVLSYNAKCYQARMNSKIRSFSFIWDNNVKNIERVKPHSNDEKLRLMTSYSITML